MTKEEAIVAMVGSGLVIGTKHYLYRYNGLTLEFSIKGQTAWFVTELETLQKKGYYIESEKMTKEVE